MGGGHQNNIWVKVVHGKKKRLKTTNRNKIEHKAEVYLYVCVYVFMYVFNRCNIGGRGTLSYSHSYSELVMSCECLMTGYPR